VVLEGHPGSYWWSGSQRECQTDLWRCTHPSGSLPFFMRRGAAPLHDLLVAKSLCSVVRNTENVRNHTATRGPALWAIRLALVARRNAVRHWGQQVDADSS
jgi:hypothetical protein